jgi:hypothetical protein
MDQGEDVRLCTSDIPRELKKIPWRDCQRVPGEGKSILKELLMRKQLPVVSVGPCGKIIQYVPPEA